MKKKYNSTDSIPHRADRLANQLESRRRSAIARQIPYHRRMRKRRR